MHVPYTPSLLLQAKIPVLPWYLLLQALFFQSFSATLPGPTYESGAYSSAEQEIHAGTFSEGCSRRGITFFPEPYHIGIRRNDFPSRIQNPGITAEKRHVFIEVCAEKNNCFFHR